MNLLFILGAAVAFVIFTGGPARAENEVLDLLERGHRLTTSTLSGNLITSSPALLLSQAIAEAGRDISIAAYAAARVSRSEADAGDGFENRAWRIWTLRNDADRHFGGDILRCATAAAAGHGNGSFGNQQGGRRYTTAKDPFLHDVELAESVLSADAELDPTIDPETGRGAEKFADTNALGGVQPNTPSWEELKRNWAPLVPQVGPDGTVFFS